MIDDILALRHQLHAHPELSGREEQTHDTVAAYAKRLNPSRLYEKAGGFGLIAVFGNEADEAVAFRADMDALPVQETTDLPYISVHPGVAHKCGHDGHTAILLRLAEHIAQLQEENALPCTAVLVFQPSEETGEGSARLLASGILQQYRIRAFYGLHNLPGIPAGQLLFRYGTFAAASVGVVLHLQGRQTHAAFPEMGINPGLAAVEILNRTLELNTSPLQTDDGFRQATLVGMRIGREAFGTSAGDGEVMFTLRAYTNSAMESLKEDVLRIACEASDAYGLRLSVNWREPFHATENTDAHTGFLVRVAERNGFAYRMADAPFRWSEDFADYLMVYPGAFFGIGSGEECPELHHPDYDFPDSIIETAARFFSLLLTQK